MVASRICCLALPRICRWKWWESWQDPEYVSIYFYILFYMRIRPNLLEWNYRLFTPAKKTYTYEVISPFFPTAPYSKVSPPIWRHQWCNASNDEVYDGSKYGMQGVRTDKDRCKGGAPTDDDLVGGTPVHHLIDGALGCCGHFVSTDTPHRGQSGEVTAILWHMCRYSIGNTVDGSCFMICWFTYWRIYLQYIGSICQVPAFCMAEPRPQRCCCALVWRYTGKNSNWEYFWNNSISRRQFRSC